MALKQPESTSECLYFTRRELDNNGFIMAWVFKKKCPKCNKTIMGKPVEKGKVKIRAKEYICPNCNFTEQKDEHESSLMVNVIYTCPYCGNKGEATTIFKRKNLDGIPSYIFECDKCKKKIGITKKLKEKKGEEADEE